MAEPLPESAFPDCCGCKYFGGPARTCYACAGGQLTRPESDSCPTCAQRVKADGLCPNELCRSTRRRIARIRAIGYQSGSLRRAINSYKYRGNRAWSVVFGRLLLGWLEENMAADPPDLIVANPSFVGPGGQGFAHTEAVLSAAAAADQQRRWHFDTEVPASIVKTESTLKSADAQAWSKRAVGYELRAVLRVPSLKRTDGKAVLVYDDICTTGTQLDAVAACLLDDGRAARVEGVVLARAPWRGADWQVT